MSRRPIHVYCQQVIAHRVWCRHKAIAPDPRNPAHSSLCARHLDEVEAALAAVPDPEGAQE